MIYYVITDGRGSYIRHDSYSNKYVSVRNKNLAMRFEQEAKAKNVLNNCLTKNLKTACHVKCIEQEEPKKETKENASKPEQEKKEVNIKLIKELSEEEIDSGQLNKWETGLGAFSDFVHDAEDRGEELSAALSEVDKEITDIQHYIELNNLNAYQGFLAYKMLQHRLRKRRKIKNELQILHQLGECKIDSSMLKSIQSAIGEIENKTYTPRVLKELFE